jgi:hypothetical protein
VQSPQPRKRKLNTEGKEESVAKRRYVQIFFSFLQRPLSSLLYQRFYPHAIMADILYAVGPQIEMRDKDDLLNQVFQVLVRQIR